MSTPPARVIVALGSNLGDRSSMLARAAGALQALACGPVRVSSAWETAPMYLESQPPFLNAVGLFETRLSPGAVLDALLRIEADLGRVRREPNGPRHIDLDLIDHGGALMSSATLNLPHPRLHERAFVLLPLVEIAPDWVHPHSGLSARALLDALAPPATPARVFGAIAVPAATPHAPS